MGTREPSTRELERLGDCASGIQRSPSKDTRSPSKDTTIVNSERTLLTLLVPPAENSKKAAYVRLHNKSYIIYPPPPPQQPVQEGGTRPNVAFCNTSVPLMQPSALIYSV